MKLLICAMEHDQIDTVILGILHDLLECNYLMISGHAGVVCRTAENSNFRAPGNAK